MTRPEEIEWAFFDFDGTLSDTEAFCLELDKPAYESFGISPTHEEMSSIAGTTGVESIPALFAKYGLEVSCWDFFERRGDNRRIYYEMPLALFDGARDTLEELRGRGVRMAIVSTTVRDCVEEALRRLDIADYFEFLVCGKEAGKHKPEPDPYLRALELAGVEPARAVVFEDSPSGVAAAQAAGLFALAFKGGETSQPTPTADEEFFSYRELVL